MLEAGILGVKSGNQFRFCFGQIEGHAIRFSDSGDEEAQEPDNLRKAAMKAYDIPSRQQAPQRPAALRFDNLRQAEAVGHQQYPDDGHRHREFVTDHLR